MDLITAKHIDIMQLLGDWSGKRVAGTGGGELHGPCPFCGGSDRFCVQPNHPEGGRWYCRQCGDNHWHDTIDFVMKRSGVNMPEALRMLDPTQTSYVQPKITTANNSVVTAAPGPDRATWSRAAWSFVRDCLTELWGDQGVVAREYLHWRGLNDQTLITWHIRLQPIQRNR